MFISKSDDISYKQIENHNRNIKDSVLYKVRTIIEYKAKSNNIPVLYADREYPSSQICNCCGHRQKIGTSRVYKCPVCGNEKVTTYQRVVGFLTPEKTYSKERKAEFKMRDWFDLNENK